MPSKDVPTFLFGESLQVPVFVWGSCTAGPNTWAPQDFSVGAVSTPNYGTTWKGPPKVWIPHVCYIADSQSTGTFLGERCMTGFGGVISASTTGSTGLGWIIISEIFDQVADESRDALQLQREAR